MRTTPALVDNIYNQDPLNYFLRESLREDFTGGSSINENFIYQSLIGGGYLKGKQFNIDQRETEKQLRFYMKFVQISVPLYQEDVQVLNKGDLAIIKLIKARVNEGYMSLGAFVSIAQYMNGIQPGYVSAMNGMAEALTSPTDQSWDGNTYPVYGELTRATYGPSLTTIPNNLNGAAIEYDTIDQGYMDAFFGAGNYEPNLMVTTPKGFSYIKSKFQTQQRFTETKLDVGVGFRGLQFNGATLVASRYCPGSYITGLQTGAQDPVVSTYLQETTGNPTATYPIGNLNPGGKAAESLWILNARKPFLNYYVSNDDMYGGGFRDFIPSANNTIIVGQVLLAHNMTMQPRYHKQIFGFTS